MVTPKKIRIGDVLIKANLITENDLKQALVKQKKEGGKLGDIIIHMGLVTEDKLLQALADQLKMQFVELEHYTADQEVVRKLPERIVRRFKLLILDFKNDQYLIGMSDPTDVQAYDKVSQILKKPIKVAVVSESALLKITDQVYRRTEDIASFAEELKEELTKDEIKEIKQVTVEAAPVAKLLDSIFEDAIQIGASDVHIEPDEKCLRIRQRVDGILQEEIIEGKKIVDALVLRIKLMAKLNISEKRLPQDGRFQIEIKNRKLDIRVSTMPIRFGESVVMRILDQSQGILSLDQIDLRPNVQERIKFHIHRPNGLILITGPTGSGKTTTLYAVLTDLNDKAKKIITIEDPVEYTLPRINQVQVNTSIDLSFSKVLRTSLRQDPEIIMVGEMRDEETARIGLRAALTGHMVLSTLHTNDAISSAMRLIDMGVEGYLVAASLRMILAQRLIRVLCETCVITVGPTKDEVHLLKLLTGTIDKKWVFKKGKGCAKCNNTGYSGRVGIHELLEITQELADIMREGDTNAFAIAAVQQKNFKPLTIAAFEYALEGRTSLAEVFRVSGAVEDVRMLKIKDHGAIDVSKISF